MGPKFGDRDEGDEGSGESAGYDAAPRSSPLKLLRGTELWRLLCDISCAEEFRMPSRKSESCWMLSASTLGQEWRRKAALPPPCAELLMETLLGRLLRQESR